MEPYILLISIAALFQGIKYFIKMKFGTSQRANFWKSILLLVLVIGLFLFEILRKGILPDTIDIIFFLGILSYLSYMAFHSYKLMND